MHLSRDCAEDVYKLLDDSLESAYWIGFILADGTIENESRIKLRIAESDKDHMEKYANYIKANVILQNKQKSAKEHHQRLVCVDFSRKELVKSICEKYQILPKKTYNPPIIDNIKISDDQWIALIIGFIDGDGTIKTNSGKQKSKSKNISIIVHNSWLPILKFMQNKLLTIGNFNVRNKPYINSRGQAMVNWSTSIFNFLLNFSSINNLPIMERKWHK